MSGWATSLVLWTSAAIGAAPPEAAPPAEAAQQEDPQLEEARKLYAEGEARFDTADFDKAIELWTRAFTIVPDSPDSARIKALLIYNIATARERSYEVTGDVSHLRQAKILMEGYAASIPALFGDGPEADDERAKITERLNAIVGQIEAADKKKKRERGTITPVDGPDDPAGDDGRGAKVMLGVGAAALAVGVGGLAMMGAGLAMGKRANDLSGVDADDIDGRRDQFDRGRTGNTLAIAGGVVGGVFAITGAVLVGIGASRAKQSKRAAIAPWMGRGLVGVGVRGRF
jgi:hypothetical protein